MKITGTVWCKGSCFGASYNLVMVKDEDLFVTFPFLPLSITPLHRSSAGVNYLAVLGIERNENIK